MATVLLDTTQITDWTSLHLACKKTFGFPEFYGMNMDALIDCLSYLDEGDAMSKVFLEDGETLTVRIVGSEDFKTRLPEVFDAFVDAFDFVNRRYIDDGKSPKIFLSLEP